MLPQMYRTSNRPIKCYDHISIWYRYITYISTKLQPFWNIGAKM